MAMEVNEGNKCDVNVNMNYLIMNNDIETKMLNMTVKIQKSCNKEKKQKW